MFPSLGWAIKITLAPLVVRVKWKLTLMLLFLYLTFWTFIQVSNWWKKLGRSFALYVIEMLFLLVCHLIYVKPVLYRFFYKLFVFLVWNEFFFKTPLADHWISLQNLLHDSHILCVNLLSLLLLKWQRQGPNWGKIGCYHVLMNERAISDISLRNILIRLSMLTFPT